MKSIWFKVWSLVDQGHCFILWEISLGVHCIEIMLMVNMITCMLFERWRQRWSPHRPMAIVRKNVQTMSPYWLRTLVWKITTRLAQVCFDLNPIRTMASRVNLRVYQVSIPHVKGLLYGIITINKCNESLLSISNYYLIHRHRLTNLLEHELGWPSSLLLTTPFKVRWSLQRRECPQISALRSPLIDSSHFFNVLFLNANWEGEFKV